VTFDEATRQYADLRARVHAGWMTQEQFAAAVGQLRVQDQRGVWWQLHPNGSWLYWDGRAWQAAPSRTASAGPPPRSQPAAAPAQRPSVARPQAATRAPRATADDRHRPLAQRSQGWFNTASIVGGGIAGVLWFLYSSIRSSREGLDFVTPIIMVALPILITVLRGPIDRLLSVFDPIRTKIPRVILIGAGLAAPFVVATLLYGKQTEYPYLRLSTIWGTLASYVIIRTPVTGRKAAPTRAGQPGGAR